MAELLKKGYQLSTLRISLERSAGAGTVRLQVDFPDGAGKPIHFDATDLAPRPVQTSSTPGDLSVPREALEQLHAGTEDLRHRNGVLWLLFTYPYGNLAGVPWERILASLDLPILRVPNFAVPPVASETTLNMVLCAGGAGSDGRERKATTLALRNVLEGLDRPLVLHVFGAPDDVDAVEAEAAVVSRRHRVDLRVHRPEGTDAAPARLAGKGVAHPWLQWIENDLRGATVDALHFVCGGLVSADQGLLAPSSPSEDAHPAWASPIGAAELSAFMTRIGAWALHLASPTPDGSSDGLRMLGDQISQTRPGAVVVEDVFDGGRGTTSLYEFLYVGGRPVPAPGISAYCHPALLDGSPAWRDLADAETTVSAVEELTLGAVLQSEEAAPAWLTSSQRSLEQWAAQLVQPDDPLPSRYPAGETATGDDPASAPPETEAARRGAEDAIKFVRELIGTQDEAQDDRGEAER